ncbi:hypothetical protein DYB32_002177 [Aphanomyces invadans]|uniref:Uncharacterized protein n=1 Tax=Aphanomyces invadans TaxID=157072 RepID=A0A418B451_9STRA|nr:hypothetical protein DYB32_002177 [Aphanomyces invadans]
MALKDGMLRAVLEAEDASTSNEDVVYAQYILEARRDRERAQAIARAEHLTRSVEGAFERSVAESTAQYERECAQLKQSMVDDILAELKLLRDNRDGVSLVRKGMARSARSSRANVSYTDGADGPASSSPNSATEQTPTAFTSSTAQIPLSSTKQKLVAKSLRSNSASIPGIVAPVPDAVAQDDAHEILGIVASFKQKLSRTSGDDSSGTLPCVC